MTAENSHQVCLIGESCRGRDLGEFRNLLDFASPRAQCANGGDITWSYTEKASKSLDNRTG
jgi:hypothetical protein